MAKKVIDSSTPDQAEAVKEMKGKATKPPVITRKAFLAAAKALTVTIDGFPMGAEVKEFSTGSYGWNINAKASIKVGDQAVPVQVGLNLTVVNSKNDK